MMPNEKKDYYFVERTQTNLKFITEQINNKVIPINHDEFYEVTNLLNCCLGLISYVYEFTNKTTKTRKDAIKLLDDIFVHYSYSKENYGEVKISIPIIQGVVNKTKCTKMSTLLCHMRNAICHGRINPVASEIDSNGKKYIVSVNFTDKRQKNAKKDNFDATLTIEQIYTFANDVANAYLEYCKNNK